VSVLKETAMRGHYFNLLIVMPGLSCVIAMISKNKDSCSANFYFTATNVKYMTQSEKVLPLERCG